MTETLAAPPLLRKQIDLGPPTFTIINKRLGGFTNFFCEAPEHKDQRSFKLKMRQKKQKTVNTKTENRN